MKLAIMQPYLFPYLGYFQLVDAVDRFVFYDDVNFIKNGWINRNRLLLNGEPHYFTVPLAGASPFTPIKDIRCDTRDVRWKDKMLATFRQAYSKAPYRTQVMGLLEGVLGMPTDSIAVMARSSVMEVMDYLGIARNVIESSRIYGNGHLKGAARVIDICRREGAGTYVNAPGGRALYDAAQFEREQIQLRFLSGQLPEYRQGHAGFVPGLSILDVAMHCPPPAVRQMVAQYEVRP